LGFFFFCLSICGCWISLPQLKNQCALALLVFFLFLGVCFFSGSVLLFFRSAGFVLLDTHTPRRVLVFLRRWFLFFLFPTLQNITTRFFVFLGSNSSKFTRVFRGSVGLVVFGHFWTSPTSSITSHPPPSFLYFLEYLTSLTFQTQ